MSQGEDKFGPNPYSSTDGGPPPKKGMSTAVKVLLILGGVFGVMAALCCGGAFYMYSRVKNAMTTDPVKVAAIQEDVLGIDMPERFRPQGGMDLGFGAMKIQAAMYVSGGAGQGQGGSVLMIMQFPTGASDAEAKAQMQEAMEKQGQKQQLKNQTQEIRKIKIDGQDVAFQFIRGTQGDNGPEMRQVMGVFPGRNGTAMVMYMCPEQEWDEPEVMAMLRSIKVEEQSGHAH